MARLFAVVAESLGRRAHLSIVSNIAALVTSATSQGRHVRLLLLRGLLSSFLLHYRMSATGCCRVFLGLGLFVPIKARQVTIVEAVFEGQG
jgi:hypothetical protein